MGTEWRSCFQSSPPTRAEPTLPHGGQNCGRTVGLRWRQHEPVDELRRAVLALAVTGEVDLDDPVADPQVG